MNDVLRTLKHFGAEDLKRMQAFSLEKKIELAKANIQEWYEHWNGNVYISFSGGKDSTVLLHLVRTIFPNVPAVYSDTGLEYPDIKRNVKLFKNVEVVRPRKNFMQVLTEYGYPIISKEISGKVQAVRNARAKGKRAKTEDYFIKNSSKSNSPYSCYKYNALLYVDFKISNMCCSVMKEKPLREWEKLKSAKPYIGIMASESMRRKFSWINHGCNVFNSAHPCSKPMSVWTDSDVLKYIKKYNIPLAKPYGKIVDNGCEYCTTGCKGTGCVFCGYGAHINHGRNFKELAKLEPRLYEFCLGGGTHNDDGMWIPTKQGLGFKYVYDKLNSLYGSRFVQYDVDKTLF